MFNWTAAKEAASTFRVTAVSNDEVTVGYPSNTAHHSSLYWDDKLSISEVDYTALKLTIAEGVTVDLTPTSVPGKVIRPGTTHPLMDHCADQDQRQYLG